MPKDGLDVLPSPFAWADWTCCEIPSGGFTGDVSICRFVFETVYSRPAGYITASKDN